MATLLLIPLEDTVVFPTMDVTLPVDVGDEERVLLVPRHDGEYASVGTIARVTERVRLPGGARGAMFEGVARGIAGAAETDSRGRLRVEVTEHPDDVPIDGRTRDLEREYRATIEEILELRGDDGRISAWLRAISEPGALADTSGYSPDLTFEQKLEILQTLDVTDRLEKALGLQRERLAELQVRRKIREDVEDGVGKQQREYVLRKQMESIRRELGEDDGSIVDEYRKKIEDAGMPDEVREQAERELGRLERMGEGGGEGNMVRTYLDWLIAVPWSKSSEERLDPVHTREVLDADHAGLDDVKDRIVEYVAVKKLRTERNITADRKSGAILTLIGPPGTGKTSIGESIARAMGREFVRMSLGGVRDEAEIRGHRRTYIGALPGRLVRALRDAGTMNPVILLDEVDKVGADWRGDPSAALLEVLDPAQNSTFRDHYLDVELDLERGRLHRDRQPGQDDPRPAAGPHGGHPLRRLHRRREDRHRTRLPVAAPARAQRPARGRGRRRATRCCRRWWPSTRARPESATSSASSGRCCARPRRASRRARPALRWRSTSKLVRDALGRQKVFQEGGRPHRGAGRGHRPGGHRHRRRRALRRGQRHERDQGRADPHRPAGRRHEGVRADRAHLRARARRRAPDPRQRLRRPRVPRPRAGGRGPQGRPERRRRP